MPSWECSEKRDFFSRLMMVLISLWQRENQVYSFLMDQGTQDFRTIYASYHPRIFRYLTRLVGQSEAEDLTQEVFLRVNRGLSEFKGDAKLSTWIYRIATNVATDRIRSRSAQESRSGKAVSLDEQLNEEDVDLKGDKKPSLEKQAMREEMSACVQDYIDSLPESYRVPVTLSEIGGLTNKEIAEALGLTVETVKIRLHRGRAKLKEKLEAGCNFDRDEEDILVCDPKADPDPSD
jgi:RNA polymerase sigma-70 factor (ECF subfamily)